MEIISCLPDRASIMVIYICISFWLLAHDSRDLSQAETKITRVKS